MRNSVLSAFLFLLSLNAGASAIPDHSTACVITAETIYQTSLHYSCGDAYVSLESLQPLRNHTEAMAHGLNFLMKEGFRNPNCSLTMVDTPGRQKLIYTCTVTREVPLTANLLELPSTP